MKSQYWGWFAAIGSLLLWLWLFIAMPSFRGLDSPEAQDARQEILIAFTVLSGISLASGIVLIRQKGRSFVSNSIVRW